MHSVKITVDKAGDKVWYGAQIERRDGSVVELAPLFDWPTKVEAYVVQNAKALGLS